MSNVVHVQFSKTNILSRQEVAETGTALTAYLNELREAGVEEDDVLETLDAINDVNVYLNADEVIKDFADGWLHQFL